MATVTPKGNSSGRDTVTVKTSANQGINDRNPSKWWKAKNKSELLSGFLGTVGFLKEQNQSRYRQASIYAKLYGNMPLFSWTGSTFTKMSSGTNLPIDRPTMSVITSTIDTLVSRMIQSRPRPVFLTDGSDYRQRNLAKQLNSFLMGEFFRMKAYSIGEMVLRDACTLGTGCVKVLEGQDHKVEIERVLATELLVDPNESMYGAPRQMYQLKLIDRSVLDEMFPGKGGDISRAEQAYPDTSGEASKTVSDLVIVAEGWRLPSGPDAKDGRHVIACSSGLLVDEEYEKDKFPFVFINYASRLVGFWAQGIPERLMGTQVEINKLLMTISSAMNLVGVPRVFVEEGSKVVKAHLNNNIGAIVTYRGTKPQYEVAPCVPVELYSQLQRLIEYAYQQEGISQLAASSVKPGGLTSGAALREYDDLQTDRFAALAKRYDNFFIDLAYLVTDQARDIAINEGSYSTIYPNKDGTKEIDLPDMDILKNTYIIQCFDSSSLPRDPAGRLQKITEMMQAGLIDPQEGRRLLDYPDIEQVDKLANASEERILQILDQIVDKGEYTPPDPFMDLNRARSLVVQYINLYESAHLEEEKAQMLRDFFTQVNALTTAAQPPQPMMPPGAEGPAPMGMPQGRPTSDLMPIGPTQ